MANRKALVTGAAGFAGNAIARALRGAGWETYGLVRNRAGVAALRREEIIPVVADIADASRLEEASSIGFDLIVSNTEDHRDPVAHYAAVRVMIDHLTSKAGRRRERPLVMFTSGSKDYGNMDEVEGDAGLRPHTEASPINPHPFAAARAELAEELLRRRPADYDVVVLRPALLYGRAGGLFGLLFDAAARAGQSLIFKARPGAIMHAVHVDDNAAAYVALAQHPDRAAVAGQAFNIANIEYETTAQVATALAKAYGLELKFETPDDDHSGFTASLLADTSQLVGSSRIRELTGWTEVMPSLAEGMSEYRMAYEAAQTP